MLLADDTKLHLTRKFRKVLLAGLTAAKKTILKGWMEPLNSYNAVWPGYSYDIVLLEKSTATFRRAQCNTITAWNIAADAVVRLQAMDC
uniref:Uncharacterized protein n=1 Tax=Anguilla anguilla TaxID=7936 RepID=A0A0E9TEF1_ANGAN